MTLTREVLDRWLHRGACAIAGVFFLATLAQQGLDPVEYPPDVFVAWAVLAALAWAWALVDAVHGTEGAWGLRAVVVVALMAGLTQAFFGWPSARPGSTPPLLQAMAPAFAISGFAFSPAASVVLGILCGLAYARIEWIWGDVSTSVGAGLVVWLTALVAGGAVDLLYRAADKVQAALARKWDVEEAIARVRSRRLQHEHWDDLIHDKVLGALRLAWRARNESECRSAAESAAEALRAGAMNDGGWDEGAVPAFRRRLLATCDRLGLRLAWEVDEGSGSAQSVALDAVCAAAEEAVTNVARHSGCREVAVAGSIGGDVIAVTIADQGCGFEPNSSRSGRFGIDRGIVARMTRVGGIARLVSSPGQGTTVHLSWAHGSLPSAAAGDGSPVEPWSQRDFEALTVLGALATGVYVVLGMTAAELVRSTSVLGAVMGLVIACSSVVTFAKWHRGLTPLGVCLGVLAVCWLGAWNLPDPQVVGWSHWFVGVLNPVVFMLVWRCGAQWGSLGTLCAGLGLALGHLQSGFAVHVGVIASLLPQLIAFVCAAWGVRHAIDLATEAVNESAAEVGRLRLAEARAEEAAWVASERRQDVMGQAGQLLERIALAEPLTALERERCRLAEAEAHDGLVAASLLNPGLRHSVRSARERGVTVALAADTNAVDVGVPEFREIVAVIVEAAQGGSRVTARLRCDQRGRVGSITLVGVLPDAHGLHRLQARIRELAGSRDLFMSIDDDLLVELWRGRTPD